MNAFSYTPSAKRDTVGNGVSGNVNVVVLKENAPVSAKKTAFQLLHLIAGPHLYSVEFWLTGFEQ